MASATKNAGRGARADVRLIGRDVETLAGMMVQQTLCGHHLERMAWAAAITGQYGRETGQAVAERYVALCREAGL